YYSCSPRVPKCRGATFRPRSAALAQVAQAAPSANLDVKIAEATIRGRPTYTRRAAPDTLEDDRRQGCLLRVCLEPHDAAEYAKASPQRIRTRVHAPGMPLQRRTDGCGPPHGA